ncbi:NADH:flavin oxidoreductase/NADH oxidase family protein [Duganella qianjiadongensis]|uniref:2,4-dienoyl-CoA reductase n=1 Tax=Duganella qianjiadongensis TaxID=2692176 RepID=A0ABW9VE84_9BURK|nr:NADH:flavin oxidoreductase/NADH oxidase family protein [Duganella qianjiadongensis]MYM37871.1 2,4-dienoyl-CoA reductase [Duganella qianjiadongensis]
MQVFSELRLPNGSVLPNRLAKAAMEENMADADQAPSDDLIRLYQRWAEGGVGLMITGNVMIDRRAMTGPGGVVLEQGASLERFRRWASAARAHGGQIWMQLNHPGRQMPAALGQPTLAPSALAMDLGKFSAEFALPRAMTEAEIAEVIERFVRSAMLAQQAGFNGVQIHAAHGYLLSQFLSPLANRRSDGWGGSIAGRARLLIEVVKAVRLAVSAEFAVAVKLNSADFQRGGFSAEDARAVVEMLNPLGIDLLELSGGSYEAPAMMGLARDDRTLAREAYFLEFAQQLAQVAAMPLMVTGGIRRLPVVEQVLASGVALAGMATALAIAPDLPRRWRDYPAEHPQLRPVTWQDKVMASAAHMAMVKHQLRRLSRGKRSAPDVSPLYALIAQQLTGKLQNRRYRQRMRQLGAAA